MNQHQFDTFLIKNEELFNSLVKYESQLDSNLLFFDLETNSEIEKIAKVYGIGLCFTDSKAFYIPWRNKDGSLFWSSDTANRIITWLNGCLGRFRIVGHNIVYDALVYENNFGFTIDPYIYSDTILMKHTLEEEPPFALKEIAPIILGPWADKAQEKLKENVIANGGKFTKDKKDMYLADTDILGEYCCWDVMLTLLLFNHFEAQLKAEELYDFFYKEEVMPLYKEVTISMKRKGFKIDLGYFQDLNTRLTKEISTLEDTILVDISQMVNSFEQALLDKKYPMKPTGNYPKIMAQLFDIALPIDAKKHTITLAAKSLKAQAASNTDVKLKEFYEWLIDKKEPLNTSWLLGKKVEVQRELFFRDHPNKKYIFNLDSGDHLGYLFFTCMGVKPVKFTDGGKPSTDKEVVEQLIEAYKGKEPWITKLSDYRKLSKLLSTYVIGILDRQIDGVIYTSMLQFGTTSSRYASRNPNLNNLPASTGGKSLVDIYTNSIRKGFIAPKGYKVIGADFSSLEPHIAAYVSGDKGLIDIFVKGEDFYSAIGLKQFNIKDATPYKDDTPNSFPVKYKELRNKIKTYALAAFYGATASRISELLECTYKEAQDLLDGYFKAFPKIRSYINLCHYSAKTTGIVKNKVGRIRHLKEAKAIYILYGDFILDAKYAKKNNLQDIRRKYKNLLNNSVNFGIQSLAATCLSRAMINVTKEIKSRQLDAHIGLSIHDEILLICREDQTTICSKLVKDCMENCLDLSPIKLKATPIIGNNYGECK